MHSMAALCCVHGHSGYKINLFSANAFDYWPHYMHHSDWFYFTSTFLDNFVHRLFLCRVTNDLHPVYLETYSSLICTGNEDGQ